MTTGAGQNEDTMAKWERISFFTTVVRCSSWIYSGTRICDTWPIRIDSTTAMASGVQIFISSTSHSANTSAFSAKRTHSPEAQVGQDGSLLTGWLLSSRQTQQFATDGLLFSKLSYSGNSLWFLNSGFDSAGLFPFLQALLGLSCRCQSTMAFLSISSIRWWEKKKK